MPQSRLGSMQGSSSIKRRLPPKVVFHNRPSSTKGCLPPKVVFHRKSYSTKGHLPSKVVFHQRSSSNIGRLPPKVVFLPNVYFSHIFLLTINIILAKTIANIYCLSLLCEKMETLFGGTVSPNNNLFGGTVLPNNILFGGTVPQITHYLVEHLILKNYGIFH